jgi:hypothetical protein
LGEKSSLTLIEERDAHIATGDNLSGELTHNLA